MLETVDSNETILVRRKSWLKMQAIRDSTLEIMKCSCDFFPVFKEWL